MHYTHKRPILYSAATRNMRFKVEVKETGWEDAVDTMAVYVAMGKDEKAWAYGNRRDLIEMIEVLQGALEFAKDPV